MSSVQSPNKVNVEPEVFKMQSRLELPAVISIAIVTAMNAGVFWMILRTG
jgi:hypothetical protein